MNCLQAADLAALVLDLVTQTYSSDTHVIQTKFPGFESAWTSNDASCVTLYQRHQVYCQGCQNKLTREKWYPRLNAIIYIANSPDTNEAPILVQVFSTC